MRRRARRRVGLTTSRKYGELGESHRYGCRAEGWVKAQTVVGVSLRSRSSRVGDSLRLTGSVSRVRSQTPLPWTITSVG